MVQFTRITRRDPTLPPIDYSKHSVGSVATHSVGNDPKITGFGDKPLPEHLRAQFHVTASAGSAQLSLRTQITNFAQELLTPWSCQGTKIFLDICSGVDAPLTTAVSALALPALAIDLLVDSNMDLLHDPFMNNCCVCVDPGSLDIQRRHRRAQNIACLNFVQVAPRPFEHQTCWTGYQI